MPSYRNITVNLHSDTAESIIEFAIPTTEAGEDSNSSMCHSPLQDDKRAMISVYIPFIPQTLFWINYRITPPPDDDGVFFVFKLFVNRREVSTWCCGYEQRFHGKCMFGLFDTAYDDNADGCDSTSGIVSKAVEKRVLTFPSDFDAAFRNLPGGRDRDRFIEVRICRANKMVRMQPRLELFNQGHGLTGDIQLQNGGFLHSQAPQRYYKFGLLDPHDRPYAQFRFYYRTSAEVDALSLHLGAAEVDEESIFTADTTLLVPDDSGISTINQREPNEGPPDPSARSSISQEYFARYPTPEVPSNDAPVASSHSLSEASDPRLITSDSPARTAVVPRLPQDSALAADVRGNRSQGNHGPPLFMPKVIEVYNPYQAWNFYRGNAFAHRYNAARLDQQQQWQSNSGPMSSAYAFLPPGHPHSLLPAPVLEEKAQPQPISTTAYTPRTLDTMRQLPPLPHDTPTLPGELLSRSIVTQARLATMDTHLSRPQPQGGKTKQAKSRKAYTMTVGGVMNRISHAFKRS